MNKRQPSLGPTPSAGFAQQNFVMATPIPMQPFYRRWDDDCKTCDTVTVWSTYYVDEKGKSTTCTTTEYDTTTLTNQPQTLVPTQTYVTQYQTLTSTLYSAATPSPTSTPPVIGAQSVLVQGQYCDCEKAWLRFLLGGIPHGVGEVIACIAFFIPFVIFFLLCAARLAKYSYNREIFFILLPFLIFLAVMVAFLPTRAFASTHDSTNHILAQHVMFAIAVPILFDVALQVYALLKRRAALSGWIDATAILLRVVNAAALVLYAVAAANFVQFVKGWEEGTQTCASALLNQVSTLNIVADFMELIALILGFFFLFWAFWRLRMNKAVLVIQAHIFLLLLIFFLWRTAHDISAEGAWSKRLDRICGPLCESGTWNKRTNVNAVEIASGANVCTVSTNGIFYFFHFPWSTVQGISHAGLNGQAPFWLLAILPIFLAALLLMMVNLLVYTSAEPELLAQPDSARYKLCYNEGTKKMEFVRLDNVGGPILPDGQPLYEIVRGNEGDGWEIREARTATVLPAWENVTVRPWYK